MIKDNEIVLIGGGGHCKACIDAIEAEGKFKIAGIVDVKEKKSSKVLGYEVLGTDEELPYLVKEHSYFLVTVGHIKMSERRKRLFTLLKKYNANFPIIVSPHSYVSKHSFIGEGTVILHGAHVNAGARIGRNCIINTSSIIEHDSVIGDHCHVATGAIINGECRVGERSFIGSNSVVSQGVGISSNTIIGAGSVVLKNIDAEGTYVGNPLSKILKTL